MSQKNLLERVLVARLPEGHEADQIRHQQRQSLIDYARSGLSAELIDTTAVPDDKVELTEPPKSPRTALK